MRNPNKMDPECVKLCKAINKIPGLQTTESCCGHGKDKFMIWFEVKSLKKLPILLYPGPLPRELPVDLPRPDRLRHESSPFRPGERGQGQGSVQTGQRHRRQDPELS